MNRHRSIIATMALVFVTEGSARAQDCLPSPLFSGNVVVPMPERPEQPNEPLPAVSRVIGDFDGDGHGDLIFGSDHGSLICFHGRANWWDFDPPVIIDLPFIVPPPSGTWLMSDLATGDFNEDGILDLAIGNRPPTGFPQDQAQRIHIMLGNGDGTFQNGVACGPVTFSVMKLYVADFDGDQNLDVGYGTDDVNFGPDTVGIVWGNGTGAFPTHTVIYSGVAASTGSGWIESADIDGDSDMDAVVDCPTVPAAILRNNGNGTFATEPLTPVGNYQANIGHTFGELNGDGRPDLVFRDVDPAGGGPFPESVCVQINDGTGVFLTASVYPIATIANQLFTVSHPHATDLDGDGRDEVVIGCGITCSATQARDQVVVFHNNGGGALALSPIRYHLAKNGFADPGLLSSDLNADGHMDILCDNSFSTTLLVNDGEGGFLTQHGTPMGQSVQNCSNGATTRFIHLTHGDVNNDGRFDLVGIREGFGSPSFLECTIMLQDQQGTFTTLFAVPLPERFNTALALDDFDHDGALDMVVSTQSQSAPDSGNLVRVAVGNGDGTFDPWILYQTIGKNPRHVVSADLNGDDRPDLVVCTRFGPDYVGQWPPVNQGPRGVTVLINNGNGSFAPAMQYDMGFETHFADIADLNGDGWPDLGIVCADTSIPGGPLGFIKVLLNNGNGTFSVQPETYDYNPASGAVSLTFADVTGDGLPDMFVTFRHTWTERNTGGVAIATNDGDGTFTFVDHLDVFTNYAIQRVATPDFDGDRNVDLAMIGEGGTVNIRLGNGDGTFEPRISYGGGVGPLIIADFDDDGRPDIGSPLGCSPDSDTNTHVGFSILLNRNCDAIPTPCPADIAPSLGDDTVGVPDLLFIINNWGSCFPTCTPGMGGEIEGDMNCDGEVDECDIQPFSVAMQGEFEYFKAYPNCNWHNGDFNNDFTVSAADLPLFCNAAGGIVQGVQCGVPCPADIAPPNGDGTVGVPDLLFIINNWGPCPK